MTAFVSNILSSGFFWLAFLGISFVVGSLLFRYLAPHTYAYVVERRRPAYCSPEVVGAILLGCFIFWPIVLIWVIVVFITREVACPLLCGAIKKVVNASPNFETKQEENTALGSEGEAEDTGTTLYERSNKNIINFKHKEGRL